MMAAPRDRVTCSSGWFARIQPCSETTASGPWCSTITPRGSGPAVPAGRRRATDRTPETNIMAAEPRVSSSAIRATAGTRASPSSSRNGISSAAVPPRKYGIRLSDHDVHQLAGNDHDLADLLAVQQFLDLGAGEGVPLQLLAGGAGGDGQAVAQLAVHLDDEGNLVFGGDGGVEG